MNVGGIQVEVTRIRSNIRHRGILQSLGILIQVYEQIVNRQPFVILSPFYTPKISRPMQTLARS